MITITIKQDNGEETVFANIKHFTVSQERPVELRKRISSFGTRLDMLVPGNGILTITAELENNCKETEK